MRHAGFRVVTVTAVAIALMGVAGAVSSSALASSASAPSPRSDPFDAPSAHQGSPARPEYVSNSEDATTTATEVQNVPITMSDGVVLEADEYIPTTCTPAKPCPVVLIQTPYKKEGNGILSSEVQPYLYQHGYIEVVVDVRGTGSSEGYWCALCAREQQDGAEVVQWVSSPAHLPANGEVALAGASYSAINQLLTVEAINDDIAGHGPLAGTEAGGGNPTHITGDPVRAIFPIAAMSDAYRDIFFAGGNPDTGFMPLWLGAVTASNAIPGDEVINPLQNGQAPSSDDREIALNAESQHLYDVTQFSVPTLLDAILGADEQYLPSQAQTFPNLSYDGPFSTVRSPITNIGALNVPTFLVGGTYDLFQRGEPINYNALDLPPTEKKLLIGPWYHDTTGGGLPASDSAGNTIPGLGDLELGWFDRWMDNPDSKGGGPKGTPNGIENFPTVETYDLGANRYTPDSQYPATGTQGQRWYLGGSPTPALASGTLSTASTTTSTTGDLPALTATGTCSRSTFQWTGGQIDAEIGTSPVCEQNSALTEAQGLTFTSAPFTKPYTISGPIEADIEMSTTASDSTVIATVSDVSSSGADDITAGSLVASLRAVTTTPCKSHPVRGDPSVGYHVVLGCSLDLDGQSIEPWHPYTSGSQQTLQPGKVYRLQIEIFPTTATIEPGHQLRVTITTSDEPHETQTLSTTTDSALGVDTFYLGGSRASSASSIYLGTTTPQNSN